ncbi:MAG: protein kinase [Rhodanobacteraceae bacterium]|nr:protein kinase [Rhodanobacteraceae bacterium]
MNLPATSVNPDGGGSVAPGMAALAQLAFAASAPAATRVAGDAAAAFAPAAADALDLDLSDPDQCRFGDYTLLGKLGQGGMGVVYRAQQHSLDREVAVKLLAAGPWASPGFIERFRLEAQSAARMQHPNIVTIHEIGEQDGLPFFSMRLVRGQSLAEHMQKQGPLPARRAAGLMRTVAEAVDYAHRLGVLHLDLKPGNVLIDEQGEPMVADFGLARRLEGTLAGVVEEVSGTPSYMAPEQATAGGRIGIGTDVYALGATLYESLTGRPPFRGATARETLEQVVHAVVPSPRSFERSVPLDLQAICMRCLRKDPAERYLSARALADDLADFLRGREVKARPLNRPQKLLRMVRREPRLSALVLLFVGSLLLGLFATTVQWNRADASANSARESLWRERAQAAEVALAEGNGFHGLQVMVSNLVEMEASGADAAAAVERQRIGTLLANAPQPVDRIPLESGQVVNSVALAPDRRRFAVATHWPDGRRSVRQYDLADGSLQWSSDTNGLTRNLSMAGMSPHGPMRYSDDGERLVAGLYQQPVFAAPGTADEIAIDSRDGRVLQPQPLPEGFSDTVFDNQARRAIVRWRSLSALRFPDRFRFYEVAGWRAVGPEHRDTSSMWLFAPDGSWLLRTLDFQRFEAVAFGSLAPRWSLQVGDDQLVRAWRFAPDGQTLALGTLDGQVLLVNAATGAVRALPSTPTDTIRWLEFDRTGASLAALSEGGQVVIWELPAGRPRSAPMRLADMLHLGRVRLADDRLALVHGNAISLWQLPPPAPFDNEAVPTPARILGRRPFITYAFDFAPEAGLLVSGGSDGAISVWRLPPAPLRRERAPPLAPETQGFDGRRLVVADGRLVRVVDIDTGTGIWPALRHPQAVDFAELSHDGRWLATIAGRTLRVFDAATGRPHREPLVLPSTPLRADLAKSVPLLLLVHGRHEDGRFVERVQAIDLSEVRARVDGLALPPMTGALALDPLGRFLLAAPYGQPTVALLDLGGAPACTPLALEGRNHVEQLALSADGMRAWGHHSLPSRRAEVVLWDLERCSHARVLDDRHLGASAALQARADGLVVHRHFQNALGLLGPEGLRRRVPTLAASQTMSLVAVSDDGRRAALATRAAVIVYDLEVGEALSSQLTAPLAGNDAIIRLAFAPDGRRLLARSIFGRWMTWSLPPADGDSGSLARLALVLDPAGAERTLTDAEAADLRADLRAAAIPLHQAASDEAPALELPAVAAAALDPHLVPLDLAPALNVAMGKPWIRMAAQGGDLWSMAGGLHRFDGIDWRIDGAIQLSGGGPAVSLHPKLPWSHWVPVAEIAARRVHVLMLLHIPMRPEAAPSRAGMVELKRTDGSLAELEIRSRRDVVTHWQPDLAEPGARVAWRGVSPTALRAGERFPDSHIYHVVLDVPPGAPVTGLRLGIGDGPMEAPLFYAVTLEVDAEKENDR